MIAKVTDIEAEKAAPEQPASTTSKLKDSSLKAAGWSYLIGDAAFVASGVFDKTKDKKGKWDHAKVGLYWGLGGLAAARYGNPSAEKQIELLCTRLGEYLKKQGVEIPKSPKTADLTKHNGIIDQIEAFLYAHPSEMLNTIYALGAGQLITENYPKLRDAKKNKLTTEQLNSVKSDLATGILVGAGSLAGLLIPEKKPDPDHPPQGVLEKAKAWVQEKPLRVSAALFWAGNGVMTYGAFAKRNEALKSGSGDKSYLWRFLIAGSYIFANALLSLSSKGHSAEKSDITPQLADVSATVIAAQPKEVQEALVQNIAGYLSAQPEIKKTAPEIAELLHAKLAETQKSLPAAGKWQTLVQKGAEPSLSPSV